jgi:hypothetical protein
MDALERANIAEPPAGFTGASLVSLDWSRDVFGYNALIASLGARASAGHVGRAPLPAM